MSCLIKVAGGVCVLRSLYICNEIKLLGGELALQKPFHHFLYIKEEAARRIHRRRKEREEQRVLCE